MAHVPSPSKDRHAVGGGAPGLARGVFGQVLGRGWDAGVMFTGAIA